MYQEILEADTTRLGLLNTTTAYQQRGKIPSRNECLTYESKPFDGKTLVLEI